MTRLAGVGWIVMPVFWVINSVFWLLVVTLPLNFLEAFDTVLKYLSGAILLDIIFDGDQFVWKNITYVFVIFATTGIAVGLILFVWSYFMCMVRGGRQTGENIGLSIKNALLGMAITVAIPFVYFFCIVGLNVVLNFSVQAISGDKPNMSLSNLIWMIGDGIGNIPKGTLPSDNFLPPSQLISEMDTLRIIITGFAGIFMFYCFFTLALILVVKIFELYTLFLRGPFDAAFMTTDGGIRIKNWKDEVLGKLVICIGSYIVYAVFVTLTPHLLATIGDKTNFLIGLVSKILIICGGGVFCMTSPSIIASLVGQGVAQREGGKAFKDGLMGMMSTKAAVRGVRDAFGLSQDSRKNQLQKMKQRDMINTRKLDGTWQAGGKAGKVGSHVVKTVSMFASGGAGGVALALGTKGVVKDGLSGVKNAFTKNSFDKAGAMANKLDKKMGHIDNDSTGITNQKWVDKYVKRVAKSEYEADRYQKGRRKSVVNTDSDRYLKHKSEIEKQVENMKAGIKEKKNKKDKE